MLRLLTIRGNGTSAFVTAIPVIVTPLLPLTALGTCMCKTQHCEVRTRLNSFQHNNFASRYQLATYSRSLRLRNV
jgi:hypothetical protein